jgi:alcohol dehydrogenase class IV
MAQALGGTYGVAHGPMNALSLAPALRFVTPDAADAVALFGRAIGAEADPAAGVERLAALGEFGRLRDFDIPEAELAAVAQMAAGRQGNLANPRPATSDEIEGLLHTIW